MRGNVNNETASGFSAIPKNEPNTGHGAIYSMVRTVASRALPSLTLMRVGDPMTLAMRTDLYMAFTGKAEACELDSNGNEPVSLRFQVPS